MRFLPISTSESTILSVLYQCIAILRPQQHTNSLLTYLTMDDRLLLINVLFNFMLCCYTYVVLNEERAPSVFEQRLIWEKIVERHANRFPFKRHLRLKIESFNILLEYIREDLEVDTEMAAKRGGAIVPELCLYCTLRWLAGGSYSDIYMFVGISTASFYRVVWKTIVAIVKRPELAIKFPQTARECSHAAAGFASISHGSAITNCVAVIDGYLLKIVTPPADKVGNVRSYFSGHYQCYGVNVQAACDHLSRFVYFAVAGPGVMGDNMAIKEVDLYELIHRLPKGYCVIGDAAYVPSENLVPIYYGVSKRNTLYDNFNFYGSQLRIRIEMAFGLMTKKFGILWRPVVIGVDKVKTLALCIAMLHNFAINERIRLDESQDPATEQGVHGRQFDDDRAEAAAEVEAEENGFPGWSELREEMTKRIQQLGLKRLNGRS